MIGMGETSHQTSIKEMVSLDWSMASSFNDLLLLVYSGWRS